MKPKVGGARCASKRRAEAINGRALTRGAPFFQVTRHARRTSRVLLGTTSMAALGLALVATTPSRAINWNGSTSTVSTR
jgi:hypothetical protein